MIWKLPIQDVVWFDLFESLLPDFILAFTFFTALCYAVLGKRFGQQRPAIAMAAAIGFALAAGLVWWERANGFSIRNLGPVAVGFAVIMLALIMYNSIRLTGGSWAGAAIAFGASILIAKILKLNIPIDPQVVQTITIVALIIGILAFVSHRHGAINHVIKSQPANIRHDMSDLYRGRRLSKKIGKKFHNLRHQSRNLTDDTQQNSDVLLQLKRMLPAEGYLTEKMAQLRAKAHRIRNGHIARLSETKDVFAKLPASAKKKASAELADRYGQMVGIDTRLERLDKAVAVNEKRIYELTRAAQKYSSNYDHQKLYASLKEAEKLQRHNSHLFKIIERTENKLSAIAKKVSQQTNQVNKK